MEEYGFLDTHIDYINFIGGKKLPKEAWRKEARRKEFERKESRRMELTFETNIKGACTYYTINFGPILDPPPPPPPASSTSS